MSASMKLEDNCFLSGKLWQIQTLERHKRQQRHHFADQGPYSQSFGLSGNQVQMWKLDNKEGRVLRSWCFWAVVREKTIKSLLESKEIKPVILKGNQPRNLFGRINAEAEAVVLCPPDANSWLFGKDPDAGNNWRQKEKRVAEDEMADERINPSLLEKYLLVDLF